MLDILLAEDDDDVRESLAADLEEVGHRVSCARDGREAQQLLDRHAFDVAICDVNMPFVNGVDLARRLRNEAPSTAVVVMTTHGRVADIVNVMRGGAVEFLVKPFDVAELEQRILRPIDERRALKRSLDAALSERIDRRLGLHVVAASPKMRALVERLTIAAHDDAPVLLYGEPGVGKKTLARIAHERGLRKDGPFVVVACAALPELMMEAELRALSAGGDFLQRDAWFREAEGGTIVLDGVDRLPESTQVNLVRVLAEPATLPRRDDKGIPRGVRVVATARENMTQQGHAGCTEPLFFRLAGLALRVPPLRERDEDRVPLAAELLTQQSPWGRAPRIEPEAWAALSSYPFPGNVTELAWALKWALLMADTSPIDTEDLPPRIRQNASEPRGDA